MSRFSSRKYWENRYLSGRNSGAGSYGRLCQYKSKVVNQIVRDFELKSLVDFGCGDGNQIDRFEIEKYTGVDASETAVKNCSDKFAARKNWSFCNIDEIGNLNRHDMSISLDVIYHLIEDKIFEDYMQHLFHFSKKFVLIYSSNTNVQNDEQAIHVRHRQYSRWVSKRKSGWSIFRDFPHPYPYRNGVDEAQHSFAFFRLYIRRSYKNRMKSPA